VLIHMFVTFCEKQFLEKINSQNVFCAFCRFFDLTW
jgi:hypothetical protein